MKKTIIKGCVFAATFIVVLIVSSLFLNRGNTDMTAEMKLPELPLVYVNVGEQHVNMMRGFLNAMDEQYMKESVMPIESDRRLSFSVKKYGQSVESLAFEVRSVDGSRLVENTEITNYRTLGDTLTADIVLKDLIEEKTEYRADLSRESGGWQVRPLLYADYSGGRLRRRGKAGICEEF